MSAPLPSARPIQVADQSSVGEARRHAQAVAERAGLDPQRCGEVSIIATELATNLHRHGGGGELLVDALPGTVPGVQLVAIDRGQGMDVRRCLEDGYSTAGSAGQGLGAVRRLSTRFDVHSQPRDGTRGGTVVLSQVRTEPERSAAEVGAVCVPITGETVCGDGWAVREADGHCVVLVVDGLGHGEIAAEAALVAVRLFNERLPATPTDYLTQAHTRLRATRGAAGTIADIDWSRGVVRFAGAGNVAGRLVGASQSRGMLTANGTLGLQVARFNESQYPWNEDTLLVLASDGIQTGWTIDRYPGLRLRHPAVIAATIYRDWTRGRDDATVVALRRRTTETAL